MKAGSKPRSTAIGSLARAGIALALLPMAGISCAYQQKMMDEKEPIAMQTALTRGRFDLNCPSATGTMLSRDFIQPAIQGPWVSGLERIEYTIGVAGCNDRTTYVVMCQEGTDTCFAAHPGDRFRGE